MSLFLLGIPIALLGAKVLHDDVKYTTMDYKIQKASYNITKQYQQINKDFARILQYSGAKCDVKKKGYGYDISNVKKGQYGGMERYLAEKGYFPQAITYAKNKFDALAEEEEKTLRRTVNNAIDNYESKLAKNGGEMDVISINVKYVDYPKPIVEQEVERIINYLHNHHNENVYCNIIMSDGSEPMQNHREVWHLKVPKGEDGFDYLQDIYHKLNIIYFKEM